VINLLDGGSLSSRFWSLPLKTIDRFAWSDDKSPKSPRLGAALSTTNTFLRCRRFSPDSDFHGSLVVRIRRPVRGARKFFPKLVV